MQTKRKSKQGDNANTNGQKTKQKQSKATAEQWQWQGNDKNQQAEWQGKHIVKTKKCCKTILNGCARDKANNANVAMQAKKHITHSTRTAQTTAQKDSTKTAQKDSNIWQHKDTQKESKRAAPRDAKKKQQKRSTRKTHSPHVFTCCTPTLMFTQKNQCSFCTQTCKNTCHAHFAHKRLKCKPSGKAKHSMAKKKHGKASQSKRSKWQRQTKKQSKQGDKTNTNGQQTKAKAMPSKCWNMNMARQRKKEATLVARQALVKSKRVLQTITFVKCKSKTNKANVAMPQKKQTTQHKDSTKHNTKGQHKDSTNGDQNQTAQGHAKIRQNNAIFTSHKKRLAMQL